MCDLLMRGAGAGTWGGGRSLRKGISQKQFHDTPLRGLCKMNTRKRVKFFSTMIYMDDILKITRGRKTCSSINPPVAYCRFHKEILNSSLYTSFKVSACSQMHVDVCLIVPHGASKISLKGYRRPGVSGGHPRWPNGAAGSLNDTGDFWQQVLLILCPYSTKSTFAQCL